MRGQARKVSALIIALLLLLNFLAFISGSIEPLAFWAIIILLYLTYRLGVQE